MLHEAHLKFPLKGHLVPVVPTPGITQVPVKVIPASLNNFVSSNFHLPKSSLLIMVCTFAGYDRVMKAYRSAIKERYQFFSYGDAMWLDKDPCMN